MSRHIPLVLLAGRVNAGKSTLFNTLTRTSKAIVSPTAGTTRDLNFATITWRGASFRIVDSGGLDAGQLGAIETQVQQKAYNTIPAADVVILVIDGRGELTAEDRAIALTLKKSKKNILLAINKIDGPTLRARVSPDFYKLGLGLPLLISAISGIGTGDLLDAVVYRFPKKQIEEQVPDLRLSIIGRTNVGKSSLLNALLGEERVIVTPLPHTTREPQDITIQFQGKRILIVDTAGLRKNRNASDQLEKIGAKKTLDTIKKSDVCLLVTDVAQPLTSQDERLAALALGHQNGIILVANKWDLVPAKDPRTINKFTDYYRRHFASLWWAPLVFTSALEKQRVHAILEQALKVQAERQRVLDATQLERFTREMIPLKVAKPSKGTKAGAIYRVQQINTAPPAFTLFVNKRERVHPSFLRFVERKLRTEFGFSGTPIFINLKEGARL